MNYRHTGKLSCWQCTGLLKSVLIAASTFKNCPLRESRVSFKQLSMSPSTQWSCPFEMSILKSDVYILFFFKKNGQLVYILWQCQLLLLRRQTTLEYHGCYISRLNTSRLDQNDWKVKCSWICLLSLGLLPAPD